MMYVLAGRQQLDQHDVRGSTHKQGKALIIAFLLFRCKQDDCGIDLFVLLELSSQVLVHHLLFQNHSSCFGR